MITISPSWISFLKCYAKPHYMRIFIAILSSMVSAGSVIAFGFSIGNLVNTQATLSSSVTSVNISILSILLITLVMSGSSFIRMYFIGTSADKLAHSIRVDLYNHVLKLAPDFFENSLYSDISSVIINDISNLQSIISGSFNHFLRSAFTLAGSLVMLFFANYMLATYTGLILLCCVLPVLYVGKKSKLASKLTRNLLDQLNVFTSERCRNVSIIQSFAQEKYEENTFNSKSGSFLQASMWSSFIRASLVTLIIASIMLSLSSVVWVGLQDVHNGVITPGSFVSFLFYAFISISSVGHIGDMFSDLQKASRIVERISGFLAVKPRILNATNPVTIDKVETGIEFKNVEFSYPTSKNALAGVSFFVPKGKIVSMVGHSGSGKSTLLKLLMRFHDADQGAILIDGINIKDIRLDSLRMLFGLVPQNCQLFSCSIAENISYGSPSATHEAIKLAADMAHCTEFIEKLPNKFDSIIGEGSLNLSGGQIQRIVIARAILKNPEILILDEATSSLDTESDYLVRSALANLMKGRTTIVIAHRLSTVSGADIIMLLNNGKIEASGMHEELLQSNATYNTLVEMQFKKVHS